MLYKKLSNQQLINITYKIAFRNDKSATYEHIPKKYFNSIKKVFLRNSILIQWGRWFQAQNCSNELHLMDVQSLEFETEKTVLFWDIFWHKNFVCMNCETNSVSECAPKPPRPTSFKKSNMHQPNTEKFQFKGSKIRAFLLSS